jgi:hypothetical protein
MRLLAGEERRRLAEPRRVYRGLDAEGTTRGRLFMPNDNLTLIVVINRIIPD